MKCALSYFKLILLLGSFIVFGNKSNAAEDPYNGEVKHASATAGANFDVRDGKFWGTSYLLDDYIDNILTFQIDPNAPAFIGTTPFTATLDFSIKIYNDQSNESTVSAHYNNLKLIVSFDPAKGINYKAEAYYKFTGAHKFNVLINSITSPQLPGNALPPVFIVNGKTIVKRKYPFAATTTDILKFTKTNDDIKIQWAPLSYPGAELFDLEYAFIDDADPIAQNVKDIISDNLSLQNYRASIFQNNSTRITTSKNFYEIKRTFEKGLLFFRVRGVQFPNEYNSATGIPGAQNIQNYRQEGNWNYNAQDATMPTYAYNVIDLSGTNDGHEENLNWQYSASFAEDGKRKEVLTYFDGTLRNRQNVTISNGEDNTDDKAIVQESFFDIMGRPAINVLPSPTNDMSFHFFRNFNLNGASQTYSYNDLLSGANSCIAIPADMNISSGASLYYSPANNITPFPLYNKYIPDAEKKPFSVTQYTPDNTGRILSQGGVGAKMQPGQNHDTKYFYGKPTQEELDRLFGLEAGQANHYLKNTVLDANGQMSVSYINASGKTVATALAGLNPTNLAQLPTLSNGQGAASSRTLITPTDFTRDMQARTLTATSTFSVTTLPPTSNYVFDYLINSLKLQIPFGHNGQTLCYDCYYNVDIIISDACGTVVYTETNTNVPSGDPPVFNENCTVYQPDLTGTINNFTPTVVGDYNITFKIRISEDAIKYFVDSYIKNNTDIKTINYFLYDELSKANFEGCYNDCKSCIDDLGTADEFYNKIKLLYEQYTSAYYLPPANPPNLKRSIIDDIYTRLYTHCQTLSQTANCQPVSPCQERYELMLADVTPGGQYALYNCNTRGTGPCIVQPTIPVVTPSGTVINVLSKRSLVSYPTTIEYPVNSGVYLSPGDPSIPLAYYIEHFDPEWAKSLVTFHPEYCLYQWCIQNDASNIFDEKVELETDPAIATTKGWFGSVTSLFSNDPFFTNLSNTSSIYVAMQNDLNSFSSTFPTYANNSPVKNIIQVIDYQLYCESGSNPSSWTNCTPNNTCRSPYMEWMLYREYYLNLKRKYYEKARIAQNPTCSNCFIGSDGVPDLVCQDLNLDPARPEFTLETIAINAGTTTIEVKYLKGNALTNFKYYLTIEGSNPNSPAPTIFYREFRPYQNTEIFTINTFQSYTITIATCSGIPINSRLVDSNGNHSTFYSFSAYDAGNCSDSTHCIVVSYSGTDSLVDSVSVNMHYIQSNTGKEGNLVAILGGSDKSQLFRFNNQDTSFQNLNVSVSSVTGLGQSPNNAVSYTSSYPAINSSAPIYCTDYPETEFYTTVLSTTCGTNGTGTLIRVCHSPGSVTKDVQVQINVLDLNGTHLDYITVLVPAGQTCVDFCYERVIVLDRLNSTSSSNTLPTYLFNPIHTYCAPTPVCDMCSSCKDNPDYPYFKDKQRIFQTYVNPTVFLQQLITQNDPTQGNTALTAQCATLCEAEADGWISSLTGCNLNANQISDLRQKLIQICTDGCNGQNPTGSSSNAAGRTFEIALKEVTGLLSSPTINCSADLISNPYPLNKQPKAGYSTVILVEDCLKNKVLQYLAAFNTSGQTDFYTYLQTNLGEPLRFTQQQLTDLVSACTNTSCSNRYLKEPITLPLLFDCDAYPCLSWSDFMGYRAAFLAKYPGISVADDNYELLFVNYINHATGFSLAYVDYDNYYKANNQSKQLCNKPMAADLPQPDLLNQCIFSVFQTALSNAHTRYVVYIEQVKEEYRTAYVAKCLSVQPSLRLTSNVYEYHYTLYYYDQSGNLVKTVPPQGVKPLTDLEVQQLEQYRQGNSTTCPSTANTLVFPGGTNGFFYNFAQKPYYAQDLVNGGYSWEFWVNPASQNDQGIFSYAATGAAEGHALILQNGLLVFRSGKSTAGPIVMPEAKSLSAGLLPTGKWTHVVVEVNLNTNEWASIFINGSRVTLDFQHGFPLPSSYTSAAYELKIGSATTVSTNFGGKIRQFKWYKRCLPAGEVAQNANNICGQSYSITGLILNAPMNEGSGPIYDHEAAVAGNINNTIGFPGWLTAGGTAVATKHTLATTYRYNSLNQVVEQNTPDGGKSNFYYDYLGRLTASQNAEQFAPSDRGAAINRFSYTRYDDLGRIAEVGEKLGAAEPLTINEHPGDANTWLGPGTADKKQVTLTIYDDYNTTIVDPIAVPGRAEILTEQGNGNSRKRVVSTIYKENKASIDYDQATHYSYDISGNVKSLWQEIKLLRDVNNASAGIKRIDYQYDLVSGKVNKVIYQPNKGDQFLYRYAYDAENRLKKAETSRDNLIWHQDAFYYYYLHGPLARVELGKYNVQGMDYAYTLQGWLKGINGVSLDPAKEMGNDGVNATDLIARDVMAFSLGYFAGDYKPIKPGANAFAKDYVVAPGDILAGTGTGLDLFNGNIRSTTVALSELNTGSITGYTYRYDQLNRLMQMRMHSGFDNTTWNKSSILTAYAEDISYDANGNILGYKRNGTAAKPDMDNLDYYYYYKATDGSYKTYKPGQVPTDVAQYTNRLAHVKDPVSDINYTEDIDQQDDKNYTYDNIGNLQRDEQENILNNKWNVYGKLRTIFKREKTIHYGYNAGGQRVYKSLYDVDNAGSGIHCAPGTAEDDLTVNVRYNNTPVEYLARKSITFIPEYNDGPPDEYQTRLDDATPLCIPEYHDENLPLPLTKLTFYIRDAQGNTMGVYDYDPATPADLKWSEQHLYGSSRLGMWRYGLPVPTATTAPAEGAMLYDEYKTGSRTYEMTNHLGNVLATISDKKLQHIGAGNAVDYYLADVVNQNDYYPFGMLQPGRSYGAGYRYGFNGKENDNEVKGEGNQQDYGMRIYDGRLGKFLSVDPLQKNFADLTPYQYSGNTPIQAVDLDGLEPKGFMRYWIEKEEVATNWGFSVRDVYDYETKRYWTVMQYPNQPEYYYWETNYEKANSLFVPGNTSLNKDNSHLWNGRFRQFEPKMLCDDKSFDKALVGALASPFAVWAAIEAGFVIGSNVSGLTVGLNDVALNMATKGILFYYRYAVAAGTLGRTIASIFDESGSVGMQNAALSKIETFGANEIKNFITTEEGGTYLVETFKNILKNGRDEEIKKLLSEPIFAVEYKGEKYILDGHNRLTAISELGMEAKVTMLSVEKAAIEYKSKMEDIVKDAFKTKLKDDK